nr:tudor domain-containing protein 7 [Parasteatoda tepidariorum]
MSGQKKRNRGYYSSLTLGQKKYDSYPAYAATAEEAEEIAASVAVQSIQKDHLHLESCPETTIRNAEDVQKLISRIEEVVCEKPSGMFTNGIVHEYENNYHESLPENWLSLLQQSNILEIEELDVPYGRVPEGVNCIVRRANSSGSTTPSSLSELEQRSEFSNNDNAAPRAIVRRDHLPAIPELTIPFGNQWFVYVVDVSKTITARLIEYDEAFMEFFNSMRAFYSSETLPAQEISEGLLYASCIDDNYQRVLAQNIKETDMVECYYVDEGVFADVPKSCLQELHSDFWTFPYQAIHLTLDGLEDYPYKPDDLDFLREKTLVALVKRWSTTVLPYFPDDPAVHKIIYSVVLYDTHTSDDVDLNEIVKEKMLESLVVKLPKLSVSSGGYYLSHVEDSGEIYLRNISDDSWLEEQLEKLSPSFEESRSKAETIPHDMIFAAKYEDGLWYRAVLTQNPSSSIEEDKVEVYFIDYGNKSIVSSDEICKLQPFSEFLSIVGPQAIKCELYSALPSPDAEWTSEAVSKLMELAPISEELLIRVINEGSGTTLPQVNLYKRTYQNGDSFIISINESLANKPELFKTSLPTPNSSALVENIIPPPVPRSANLSRSTYSTRSSSSPTTPSNLTNDFKWVMTPDNLKSPDAVDAHNLQPLKLSEVPDIGQIFDIFVTMSANPDIFYIQPLITNKETTELGSQMDQFYSSEDNLIEMELSLLKVNEYYAVRHSDGHWYRSQLQSIISDDPVQILVNYVDYGDLLTVNMSQLQSLYSNFRHLPCQAIKASLAGIKPVERDWRPLHCVEFKNMVEEKVFSSIVRRKTYRESRGNKVLELELTLIDVSVPGEDVYIHETLINRGIARPA